MLHQETVVYIPNQAVTKSAFSPSSSSYFLLSSEPHHNFVLRSVQLACAKVGANSNLIVAAVIRDVMTRTYTAWRSICASDHNINTCIWHGPARRIVLVDTSIRHHWSHPLSWRLTRQENRGMQVRSRDASLTRPFLRVKGVACETN